MYIPEGLLYSKDHVWIKKEDGQVRLGLTGYAQSGAGDVLLIELPETGRQVKKGENLAIFETAKAIFDVKAPVSGTVAEVNTNLEKKPELIKDAPYTDGWMILLKADLSGDFSQLMDSKQYEAHLKEEGAS